MKSLKSYNRNAFQPAECKLKKIRFLFWGFNTNNPYLRVWLFVLIYKPSKFLPAVASINGISFITVICDWNRLASTLHFKSVRRCKKNVKNI